MNNTRIVNRYKRKHKNEIGVSDKVKKVKLRSVTNTVTNTALSLCGSGAPNTARRREHRRRRSRLNEHRSRRGEGWNGRVESGFYWPTVFWADSAGPERSLGIFERFSGDFKQNWHTTRPTRTYQQHASMLLGSRRRHPRLLDQLLRGKQLRLPPLTVGGVASAIIVPRIQLSSPIKKLSC